MTAFLNKLYAAQILHTNLFFSPESKNAEIKTISRGVVKNTRLEAKDSSSEDRLSRGQGQECSKPKGPRTQSGSALPKKKERSWPKTFTNFSAKKQAISTKKGLRPQIRKFSTNFKRQKFFFATSLACSKTKQHNS